MKPLAVACSIVCTKENSLIIFTKNTFYHIQIRFCTQKGVLVLGLGAVKRFMQAVEKQGEIKKIQLESIRLGVHFQYSFK